MNFYRKIRVETFYDRTILGNIVDSIIRQKLNSICSTISSFYERTKIFTL